MGAAVRIVLQTLDHAGDADLVTTEIDDAIMLLVTATLMTHGDAAEVIAAALLQARLHHLDYKAAAGGGRLYFNQCHRLYPSLQTARRVTAHRRIRYRTRASI